MTRWTRRRFGAAAGAAALAGIAAPSIAAAAARLVVVGGGPAGATVARYLSQASPQESGNAGGSGIAAITPASSAISI